MKKATTIDEIYSVFAPEKFLKPEDEEFYVDLYSKDLRRFVGDLSRNELPTKSFFIAGQSGNGKTTILNLLSTKYPKIDNKYEIIYMAGKEVFDYENIDIVDILLMMANKIVLTNPDLQNKYIKKIEELEALKNGDLQKSISTSKDKSEELKASAKLSLSAKFFSMIKASGDFSLSYRLNDTIREEARQIFKVQKKELITIINDLVLECKKINNKELLFIIDDLEKKDNTDKLFLEDLRSLDDIEVTKIITMPIHLRRTQTFQDKDIREFALKLHGFDGKKNEEDRELLKEVIDKRIEKKSLINETIIDRIIDLSGGNLRQLAKLIHFAASEASTFEAEKISEEELAYAKEHLERQLSSVVMLMRNFLKEINENKMPKEDNKDSLDNLGKAIKMGLVYAYFNGKIWYELNPLAKELIDSYDGK